MNRISIGSQSSQGIKDRYCTLWQDPDVRKSAFAPNEVITSLYTVWNFLPVNFMEQLKKPANFYFFILMLLQCTPESWTVSTTSGMPVLILPLSFIFFVRGIKDALEDWRRHAADKEENNRPTRYFNRDGQIQEICWRDVKVGDLVLLYNREMIPADMVLVRSAEETGMSFVETANLDGETNLKTKQAHEICCKMLGKTEAIPDIARHVEGLTATIVCEPPNASLYTFVGTLEIARGGKSDKVPLNEQQVLLRGCKLRSVAWAVGVVVYTGKDSKIQRNSSTNVPRKIPRSDREISRMTLAIFFIQCILCLVGGIISAVSSSSEDAMQRTYLNYMDQNLQPTRNTAVIIVVRFLNFCLLFSNFIPISLLVCVTTIKLMQAFLFYQDRDMIYNGTHAMPRTSDLNDELGQIGYVFSDKTGTLTCNVMDFRKFCVDGLTYGEGLTEIRINVLKKMGQRVPPQPTLKSNREFTTNVNLVDNRLEELLRSKSGSHYHRVRNFFLHLAINHEVIPETGDQGELLYSASSPDEGALVYGAKHFGFQLKERTQSSLVVKLENGMLLHVKVLVLLKFTSTRKRSTVIVEFQDTPPEGGQARDRLMLFCKGADTVIMSRLATSEASNPQVQATLKEVDTYAEDGLRTLCIAGRDLSREEFDRFDKKFQEASLATQERQEKIDEVSETIECNLELHGITGIEDRLQDGVGDTIVALQKAGIKVWMLTGDKSETAVNIGIATGLLEATPDAKGPERPIITYAELAVDDVLSSQHVADLLKKYADRANASKSAFGYFEAVVVDGQCLEIALLPKHAANFADMCKVCKTVICCRVSPQQKGEVVRLIKSRENAVMLAIGDGANDCNMIQSADVGVGIRGLEGLQAFNVSDYGIAQFRFLGPLLLVHGRWCYRRIAVLANYMFYKNVVVVMPQYFLAMVSGFSGQKLYNDLLYQSYNVCLTMFPITFWFALFDQDVSKSKSMQHPELYVLGHQRKYMRLSECARWSLNGLWHSICIFWIPYMVMTNGNITHADGKANDLWLLGTVVYFLIIVVTNMKVLLDTACLNWMTWFYILGSFVFWFAIQLFADSTTFELCGLTVRTFSCPMIWITMFVTTCACLLYDYHWMGIERIFMPNEVHRVQHEMYEESRTLKVRQ